MKDMLGQELVEGDYVSALFSDNETPGIFQITGFTQMKCRLWSISNPSKSPLKFARDMIKVCPIAVSQVSAKPPEDGLGQLLEVGDYVFGSGGSYIDPIIFEITAFVPRKAIVKKIFGRHYYSADDTRYLTDLIKINPALVTMHCLTKENT
jgi:hypothetical protein